MSRRLVSINQAAQHFQVATRTVENWLGRGYFTAYRSGKRYLIDLDEASRAIDALPASKAKPGNRRFGPQARIVALPVQPEVVTLGDDS